MGTRCDTLAAGEPAPPARSLDAVQSLLRAAGEREPELSRAVQKAIDGARVTMTESRD